MAQFYFLSVLMNILAGLILVYGIDLSNNNGIQEAPKPKKRRSGKKNDDDDFLAELDNLPAESEEKDSGKENFVNATGLNSRSARLVVGVLSVIIGVLKILSVFRNDIPVIGDLVPVVAGLMGGCALLVEYFKISAAPGIEVPDSVQKVFIDSRKYIGILCLVAAVLHFVFPQVILL